MSTFLLTITLSWLSGGQAVRETQPLLRAGPEAVGFTHAWRLDSTRTYVTAFDEGATYGKEPAPRPLLVNLWYPARAGTGQPMVHGQYFEIEADVELAPLSGALGAYARGIFVQQVLGVPEDSLDEDGRTALAGLLGAPTTCLLGAEAAAGPFPLVVWHSGAESSFEDDALFCEFLASHGLVVVGSAYQEADGSGLGVDGGAGSVEDLCFLVRYAGRLPFVDSGRVAVAGHSLGAQAALRHAAAPGATATALLLFDTTLDYYGLSMPLFGELVDEVTGGAERIGQAILALAGPEAHFALLDGLTGAERTYLTVPGFDHDDFIVQGHQRREILARRPAGIEGVAQARECQPATRARFEQTAEIALAFLRATLEGQGELFSERMAPLRETVLGQDALHVEVVPRGTSEPAPYDLESSLPPTPRQLFRLVAQKGAGAACAVLDRHQDTRPVSPIYSSSMLMGSLLFELRLTGGLEQARELYACLIRFQPRILGVFEFLADMSFWIGKGERARPILDLARDLDPERPGVLERLRRLEGEER